MRARLIRVWHFGQPGRSIVHINSPDVGNENNQACNAAALDRDCKLHSVIALLAFERANVEARFGRLNAGKSHRLAAFGARENADICDTK